MNRRKLATVAITAVMALGFSAIAAEKKAEPKKQTTCPVMGGKINKAQYADVKGKRIYVCCTGCIAKIKADSEKYIKQLEAEGIALDKAVKKDVKTEEHKHDQVTHQN